MLPRKLGRKYLLIFTPWGCPHKHKTTQESTSVSHGKKYHIYLEVHVLVVKYYFNCLQHTKSTQGDPAPSKPLSYAIKPLIIKQ